MQTLSSVDGTPTAIAVDDTSVYVSTMRPGATSGQVVRLAKGDAGVPLTALADTAGNAPAALALDADSVYWVASGTNGVPVADGLMKVPKSGGPAKRLNATPVAGFRGLAIDSARAFFAFQGVNEVRLADGAVSERVAPAQDGRSLFDGPVAADATSVYFIRGFNDPAGTIMRFAKP